MRAYVIISLKIITEYRIYLLKEKLRNILKNAWPELY